jgi:hypothetical protein
MTTPTVEQVVRSLTRRERIDYLFARGWSRIAPGKHNAGGHPILTAVASTPSPLPSATPSPPTRAHPTQAETS